MIDRRMSRRYDMSLAVNIRLPANQRFGLEGGRTRDISSHGVYFTTQKSIASGTLVDFTVILPTKNPYGIEVIVHARGSVVRVDRREDQNDDQETIGVAAVIERYHIIRCEPPAA